MSIRISPWGKNKVGIIKLKGINPVERIYLKKIGETSIKSLTFLKAEQLFLLVVENFKKGVLSSDEVASFGFKIFHGIAKHYPKSDLFQASLSASELSFCTRMKEVYDSLPKLLKEIDLYYDKNRKPD